MEGESESRKDRKRKEVGEINNIFQATLASQDEFLLKNSYILDSGSSFHVSHNLKRFHDFQRAPLGHHAVCGSGSVTIQGYGEVEIPLTSPKGRIQILRLHNVAYCPDFPTNLVSLRLLEARGIDWSHRNGQLVFHGDSEVLGSTKRAHGQYVLKHQEDEAYTHDHTSFAMVHPIRNRYSNRSREVRTPAWANPNLWHERLGHIGPTALTKLGQNTIRVRLQGSSTMKCSNCAMAKITRQISHRPNPNKATQPFYHIHLDWFDVEEGWDGYQYDGRIVRRCLLITCEATPLHISRLVQRKTRTSL